MTAALGSFLARYDLAIVTAPPVPRRAQIGGIARPELPCLLEYSVR